MKTIINCQDKYEAQKLSSLIYIKDGNETFITEILNIVENELVISLKDKSAHSIILESTKQVETFADFIQSVIEKQHKIISTVTINEKVEIVKG
ncbi:MAG: hypothetical protein DWQ18_08040 [Crenarchaeota archaeon]|nr:MAG: hypothetical protein DWQ17_01745 [Thermoproteota archaeon]RDJ33111.1 MAG: hypothetical protein DWQ18_08040 [Thermoproteota archaeon]RDJ36385.1 MAG: hypothetical protein DWQ19_07280 [Thermoproteota archaeon]RDJ39015.1 MAG: hypothetical protein DWQ13_01745 [Thermoproteota archaeon]